MPQSIGLADLIQQVKKELLSTVPGEYGDTPIMFVESVDLELQVTVSREGGGGIKIDVLSFGGAEASAAASQERSHTVKVKLSPLFDKEKLMEFYEALHADKIPFSVKQSLNALLKGTETNPDELY